MYDTFLLCKEHLHMTEIKTKSPLFIQISINLLSWSFDFMNFALNAFLKQTPKKTLGLMRELMGRIPTAVQITNSVG